MPLQRLTKLKTRFFYVLASSLVALSSLLIINPVPVLASACNQSAGGAGGPTLLYLDTNASAAVADTVQKVGYEFKPITTFPSTMNTVNGAVDFALNDCSDSTAYVSWTIGGQDKKLVVTYGDGSRSSPFVLSTDYDNVDAGVTFSPVNNNQATATYTFSSLPTNTTQLISIDLSNSGWIDIYLKQGSGTDTRLISLLAPAGTAKFLNTNNIGTNFLYIPQDSSWTTCNNFTGSSELEVRILFDGVATDLTAVPDSTATCASFDKSSYASGTKTATLKYDVAGAAVNHQIILSSNDKTTSGGFISTLSSLALSGDSKNFTGGLSSSSSSSQQIYFGVTETQDGKATPKDVPYPIAGGIIDMSAGDINLTTKGVVLDTSATKFSAVAHNMNTITKDGTFTLFVPYKAGTKYVGICAGAAKLDDVSDKCTGVYYLKDGQTKTSKDTKSIPAGHSVKAKIITVGTVKFWQVDGLTGSGAVSSSVASDPDTGLAVNATSLPVAVAAIMATLGFAFVARRYATKR